MDILCCALALLGSVVGAGFASGREIVRFFAAHGAMGFVAVAFLWRRSPRCSSVWPSACPPPGRPAFPACARRASARASAGSARRCFSCSPP